MKKFTAFILLVTFFNCCLAQTYLEPFIGYQTDLNSNDFKQLNTGLQCSFKKSKRYEFILQLQKSWPLAFTTSQAAFTPNPSLPVYINAKKDIRPGAMSMAIGHRIKVAGKATANIFSVIVFTGGTYQHIKVNYQYDKNNYSILNPDKTQQRVGLFLSGGAEYMRIIKSGRIFFQLNAATPPAGKKPDYPSSFNFMAPLAFNAGYAVLIKK